MKNKNVDLFGNKMPSRHIEIGDALVWLNGKKFNIIITSLPDMEEVGLGFSEWGDWIREACMVLINSLNDCGVVFFYQTDRKYKGRLIDKKTMISKVFNKAGYNNIFSKIVLRREPNKVDLFRPTYTNLFCFSKTVKSGRATSDVIYSGEMIYNNAMGFNAVKSCLDFVKSKGIKGKIIDPFCGRGSVLKIANDLGYDSVGVDISEEQVRLARTI